MLFVFKSATLLLVAISMGLALDHALELPGKTHLGTEAYLTVQTIYYPEFIYGSTGNSTTATMK
jgi:hypothetical protein